MKLENKYPFEKFEKHLLGSRYPRAAGMTMELIININLLHISRNTNKKSPELSRRGFFKSNNKLIVRLSYHAYAHSQSAISYADECFAELLPPTHRPQ